MNIFSFLIYFLKDLFIFIGKADIHIHMSVNHLDYACIFYLRTENNLGRKVGLFYKCWWDNWVAVYRNKKQGPHLSPYTRSSLNEQRIQSYTQKPSTFGRECRKYSIRFKHRQRLPRKIIKSTGSQHQNK